MNEHYTKSENARMVIQDNIMRFDKYVMQLSNVSSLKITKEPPKTYSLWAVLAVILGFAMLFSPLGGGGFFLLLAGAFAIFLVYAHNRQLEEYLIISLNSGDSFLLSCTDHSFLSRAQDEIAKCFNNQTKTVINFQNCKIESSQIGTKDSIYGR